MKFTYSVLAVTLALGTASIATRVPVPAINAEKKYAIANLEGLTDEPAAVSPALATTLLDILENYGLTNYWGVTGAHSHINLTHGQVMCQSGSESRVAHVVGNYDEMASTNVPYNYRVTDAGELLPLDLGPITSEVIAARSALAAATADGCFLREFSTASKGVMAGIAYIRPIERHALEYDSIVMNRYDLSTSIGIASTIPLSQISRHGAVSFYTRGIGHLASRAQATDECDDCIFPFED